MSTPTQLDLSTIRQHVDETNRGFERLLNAGDAAKAARETYTRDACILPPGADEVRGRNAIAAFWPVAIEQLGVTQVELATEELQPMGDGAYEIGRAALTMRDGSRIVGKYVVIWRHEDGRWRWHVDIWNT